MSVLSNDSPDWSFPRSVFILTLICPHCPTRWHSEVLNRDEAAEEQQRIHALSVEHLREFHPNRVSETGS